jgi:Tfp pilus assembly protein PilN
MRPVNLLPSDSASARRKRPAAALLAAASTPVLAIGLVYLGWSVEHAHVRDRQAELASVQAQIQRLTPVGSVTAGNALAVERAQREASLRSVLTRAVPWDTVLDQVARVMPTDTWLTALSVQSPTPTGVVNTTAPTSAASAQAPTGFTISGGARSQAAVGRLLARLALVPSLMNVTLSSTTSGAQGKLQAVQFQIGAAVRAGAGS